MHLKPLAFIRKDFLHESSYKLGFLLNLTSVLTSILGYYFIDILFGRKIVPHLQEFGVSYFSYVLLGMAFFSYAGTGLGSFSYRIQAEQTEGTLESILLTPTKIPTILFSIGLWNFLIATFNLILYILFAVFVFKIDFSRTNLPATAVIFLLTTASFSSLGIISASFIMIFKRGSPVGWIINALEGILGGVYFPIAVLPPLLQAASKILPITYGIRAIELAVYKGLTLSQLWRETTFLFLFTLFLMPLSLAFFKWALKKAKRDGSLAHY